MFDFIFKKSTQYMRGKVVEFLLPPIKQKVAPYLRATYMSDLVQQAERYGQLERIEIRFESRVTPCRESGIKNRKKQINTAASFEDIHYKKTTSQKYKKFLNFAAN